ncbi:MAG TPA: hypothetical protein VG605_19480 [Puia sp.]|nr:hypothetical protein [Puia sp.]
MARPLIYRAILVFFSSSLFAQNTFPLSGSVGIGTTSPATTLDVRGTDQAYNFNLNNTSANDNILSATHGTNNFNLIGTYSGWDQYGVYLAAYNVGNVGVSGIPAAAQHVYIGNPTFNSNYLSVNIMNGAVGIGTNQTGDANNRLFVKTGIRTRKVTVDQSA